MYDHVGVTLEEGTGATMSDDEDELQLDYGLDGDGEIHDMTGFGPLMPTESERTLMERVRQELKNELKQVLHLSIITSFSLLNYLKLFILIIWFFPQFNI